MDIYDEDDEIIQNFEKPKNFIKFDPMTDMKDEIDDSQFKAL